MINLPLSIRLFYLSLFNLLKKASEYHECFTKNRDGTNRLIEKRKSLHNSDKTNLSGNTQRTFLAVFKLARKKKISGALIGVGFLVVFIVNNENILTDGRRYRKRPKIEM